MINEFFLNRVTFLSSVSTSNELTVSDYISSGSVLYDQTGNSSNWNSVYTDVSNTSAEWDSVYTDVVNTSGNWNSVYTDVVNTSGNWDSVYSEFNQNSSTYTTYNYVDNNFLPASGGSVSGSFEVGSGITSTLYVENQKVGINTETPNEALTIVGNISANGNFYADGYNNQSWDNSTTVVENTSGNWNSVYTDVINTSAEWDSVYSDVVSTSSNWNSVYTDVVNTSAEWDSVYTTVNTNSSDNWDNLKSNEYTHTNFLPLSGGILNGSVRINNNLTVYGNISATGNSYFSNTVYSTTSALSVVNIGNSGPAFYVGNNGSGDIASFYDIDENIEVLHVGGNNGSHPNVGVKTSEPNKDLTINGELSASSTIWDSVGNSNQWNSVYTSVNSNSATTWNYQGTDLKNLSSGWVGGNSAFTNLVSNSANNTSVYTSVNANSSTYATISFANNKFLPLSGGNITGKTYFYDNLTVYGNVSAVGSHVFEANNASPALRITQSGSGDALVVEDSTNPDSTPFKILNDGSIQTASYIYFLPNPNETQPFIIGTGDGGGETPTDVFSIRSTQDDILRYDNTDSSCAIANNSLYINLYSNVGIGTTIPNQRLTVSGNISATGNLYGNASTLTNVVDTTVRALTSNYSSVYTSVNSNSATYATISFANNKFLPLSGGTINGDLTITGNLSTLGTYTQIDTQVFVTSAVSVTNTGTGPALTVKQTGSQDIATFFDDSNTALIIKDGGRVGIGTSSPISKVNIVEENENAFRISNNELHQYYASFGCILSAGYFTAGSSEARDVPLIFRTALAGAETERVRFAADGKVGINTSTPNERLTVSGNISSDGNIYADTAILTNATIQTFTNPATATGNFLILNINGSNKAIRLWDFTS